MGDQILSIYSENLEKKRIAEDNLRRKFSLLDDLKKVVPWRMEIESRDSKSALKAMTCMTFSIEKDSNLRVVKAPDSGMPGWKGFNVCNSVFLCAICSSRERAERANRLKRCIAQHELNGGIVLMMTLTAPHTRDDGLKLTRGALKSASRSLGDSKIFRRLRIESGLIGVVRAWEETFAHANGWHPHSHQLLFLDAGIDAGHLRGQIFKVWKKLCLKNGLMKPEEFTRESDGSLKGLGVNIQEGNAVANYLMKSEELETRSQSEGLAYELTAGDQKIGKKGSFLPFDILRLAAKDIDLKKRGLPAQNAWALPVFLEYVEATFGTRMVTGLTALEGKLEVQQTVEEVDQEREEYEASLLVLAVFDRFKVKEIVHLKLRFEVLAWLGKDMSQKEVEDIINRMIAKSDIPIKQFEKVLL